MLDLWQWIAFCLARNNKTNKQMFQIPILLDPQVKLLNPSVVTDLELLVSQDTDLSLPLYAKITGLPSDSQVLHQFATHYTTNKTFLEQTQEIIPLAPKQHNLDTNAIRSLWASLRNPEGFCEKYQYVDWNFAKHLNRSSTFNQLSCLYNISSPLFSLAMPFFVLLIPFFVLWAEGCPWTFSQYWTTMQKYMSTHPLYKGFVSDQTGPGTYVSAALYLFSIYQNVLACIRFVCNMRDIAQQLQSMQQFVHRSLDQIHHWQQVLKPFSTYQPFLQQMEPMEQTLKAIRDPLDAFELTFSFSLGNGVCWSRQMGTVMSFYYESHESAEWNTAVQYALDLDEYGQLMAALRKHIGLGVLGKAKIQAQQKNKTKIKLANMYYPLYFDQDENQRVKNSVKLQKHNWVITGPNASGKTTTLKTVLLNLLLVQQIGYGCFKKATCTLFDYFHCYLNIPDTSGRDSLFQAEARRCKDILDCLSDPANQGKTHFGILDELYSGTNPEEAVQSAFGFMKFLAKQDNLRCILTTHYVQLCAQLEQAHCADNYCMRMKADGSPSYQLVPGTSHVKGGLKVLRDMDYPAEILLSAATQS